MSGTYKSVIQDLSSLSIETVKVPFCSDVQNGIACHADIVCCHLGDNNIVVYHYDEELEKKLESIGFNLIYAKNKLKSNYPKDIILNSAIVDKWLICKKSNTDKSILDFFKPEYTIDTSQGYAKCSTLIVNENSIITADSDIEAKAKLRGIDVLKIDEGSIKLDGYDYGFIGGCGAKIDRSTLYFTGNIKSHPQGNIITDFVNGKGIKIISGSYNELIDIGSIIVLKEKS